MTYLFLKSYTQVKTPRILNLLQEARPGEDEVKSEAAFQRLIASGSDLPLQPRTPRAASDRGRYPEEAGEEEIHRDDTPSDDDNNEENAFTLLQNGDSLGMVKPLTPAGSVCGDEISMVSESPGWQAMDVDMVSRYVIFSIDSHLHCKEQPMASPSLSHTPAVQWRHTPPPTTSAVRSNKRKCEFQQWP